MIKEQKHTILIFSLLFSFVTSNAQFNREFNYFSFSGGITNGLFNFQDLGETNKLLQIDDINEQLINIDKTQFCYTIGFNIGFYYNIDFKNENMGLTTGIQYQLTPFKTNYITDTYENEIKENNLISSLSIPFYFKYGKKFYEPMRYLFFGVQANYYISGKSNYRYLKNKTEFKISNDMLSGFSPGFILGFNYNFLNLKIEYSPFQIVKESPIYHENLTENKGHSKHFINLQTNINIPINTWSRYDPIETMVIWIRRLFR